MSVTADYSAYLNTDAAKSPMHGFFAVYPLRIPQGDHTTGKRPCDIEGHTKNGVYGFTHPAEEVMEVLSSPLKSERVITAVRRALVHTAEKQVRTEEEGKKEAEYLKTVEITLCLGRTFSVDDGFMTLDFDGYHPSDSVSNGTGYREVSSSGTGDHILFRVPKELFPVEDDKSNKIKRNINGCDIELFYGKRTGIALSGREATTGIKIDLDLNSDAGKTLLSLISQQKQGDAGQRLTAARPQVTTPTKEEVDAVVDEHSRLITSLTKEVKDWPPKEELKDTDDASARLMSICNLIAGRLRSGGFPVADDGITISVCERIVNRSSVWMKFYAEGKGHDPAKLIRTIRKAIAYMDPSSPVTGERKETLSLSVVKTDCTPSAYIENESQLSPVYTAGVVVPHRPRQQGWETDAAEDAASALKKHVKELVDFADCGNGVYACRDELTGLWTILTGSEDPVFKRFCGRVFRMASDKEGGSKSSIGKMTLFQTALWDMITVHRCVPLHQMDCGAPLTCIPTLDGYISLTTGEKVETPPTYEYQPFRLTLTTEDAVYNPKYKPQGRGVADLSQYIGDDTLLYLISLTAASISKIPANRRVTVLTGAPRSSKTTFGKILGMLGLAPPPEIDFGCEVDGKGKFRANLMKYIGLYPMLFVNDPADPDGNVVKRFCDTTQLYERKYVDDISVYQRASVVLTMNNVPDFSTSGMEAKIRYCHTQESYIGREIAESEYMAEITSDGSLKDIWQLIIRHVLAGGLITLTEDVKEFDRMMHSRTNALNKWLGLCKPGREGVPIHTVYLHYMVYANPESDRQEVIDICNLHAKQANWKPRGGIAGESKHKIVTELTGRGIAQDKKQRLLYITLPGSSPQMTIQHTASTAGVWSKLGGQLESQTLEGIQTLEKGIEKASGTSKKASKGHLAKKADISSNASVCQNGGSGDNNELTRGSERASSKKTPHIISPSYCDNIIEKDSFDALRFPRDTSETPHTAVDSEIDASKCSNSMPARCLFDAQNEGLDALSMPEINNSMPFVEPPPSHRDIDTDELNPEKAEPEHSVETTESENAESEGRWPKPLEPEEGVDDDAWEGAV